MVLPRPRLLLSVALILTALTVQVTVLSRLPLPGATPDLLLLCVVGLALVWGPGPGSVVGFCAGLALDLVPPVDSAVGQWALVLCLLGYACGLVQRAADDSVVVPIVVAAAASAASIVVYAATAGLIGDERVTWPLVAQMVPTGTIYAVVLSPFVVPVVLALARHAQPDPVLG